MTTSQKAAFTKGQNLGIKAAYNYKKRSPSADNRLMALFTANSEDKPFLFSGWLEGYDETINED